MGLIAQPVAGGGVMDSGIAAACVICCYLHCYSCGYCTVYTATSTAVAVVAVAVAVCVVSRTQRGVRLLSTGKSPIAWLPLGSLIAAHFSRQQQITNK